MVERVVVVVFGVLLVCWVTVVVVSGTGGVVLVVLSEKQDVSNRVRSIKVQIPIREIVFMRQHYSPEIANARWGNA